MAIIYNKEPIQVLWDLVSSLSDEIAVYKETMDEDKDSTKPSYLLLRSDVSNSPNRFGDGLTKIRSSDCDIILVSKGIATVASDLHNVNKAKVKAALDSARVAYSGYNLGYDESIKSTQYTWSLTIYYDN